MLIRSRSGGAKSLDDFCRLFYGPPSSGPKVIPYDFEAVITALNTVLPYDWRGYWTERLDRIKSGAPLEGLAASGWRVVYSSESTSAQKGYEALYKEADLRYSLGFTLLDDGNVISNLIPDSPADQAGVAPGGKLVAVDGRKYSKEVLGDALKAGGAESRTIALLVEKDNTFRTFELRYTGGARHPRLERDAATPDTLTVIGAARTQ